MNRIVPALCIDREGQIQDPQPRGHCYWVPAVCQALETDQRTHQGWAGWGRGMVTSLGATRGCLGAALPACVPHLLQPTETSRLQTRTSPPSAKPLREINLSAD